MNTAEYLVKKLEELGVNEFFGLPGDYNFNLLYAVENNPKYMLDWMHKMSLTPVMLPTGTQECAVTVR